MIETLTEVCLHLLGDDSYTVHHAPLPQHQKTKCTSQSSTVDSSNMSVQQTDANVRPRVSPCFSLKHKLKNIASEHKKLR